VNDFTFHGSRATRGLRALDASTHARDGTRIGATLLFTPHLIPLSRGMLVSAYGRLKTESLTTALALELLRADTPTIPLSWSLTSHDHERPLGSNLCFVIAGSTNETGWLLAMTLSTTSAKARPSGDTGLERRHRRDETLGLSLTGAHAMNNYVVKIGSRAGLTQCWLTLLVALANDVVALRHDSTNVVIVHGGDRRSRHARRSRSDQPLSRGFESPTTGHGVCRNGVEPGESSSRGRSQSSRTRLCRTVRRGWLDVLHLGARRALGRVGASPKVDTGSLKRSGTLVSRGHDVHCR